MYKNTNCEFFKHFHFLYALFIIQTLEDTLNIDTP